MNETKAEAVEYLRDHTDSCDICRYALTIDELCRIGQALAAKLAEYY